MNNVVTINKHDVSIKEYSGQRVVTFKDIDAVHERPEGTAGRNFRDNKVHFIEGEDYFKICPDEIRRNKIMDISPKLHQDIVFLTESGYLMLVKSFTDDLAWKVQRQLVNAYFTVMVQPTEKALPIEDAFRMIELVNQTPADRIEIVCAILKQSGFNVPTMYESPKTSKCSNIIRNFNSIDVFIKNVDVTNQPTSTIYDEYLSYCEANDIVPISKIAFSKKVNYLLGTHVMQKKINGVNRKVFAY